MRSFLPTTVPWGRPALADVPVPPFADGAEHRRYLLLLQMYVALVDDGAPSLSTKVLVETLDRHPFGAGPLSWVELEASLATYFPVPWTPAALAEAMKALGRRDLPRDVGDGSWRWGYDPDFTATAVAGGGWRVERHERGSTTSATLEADGDLALLWMADFTDRHAYPFAHRIDGDMAAALGPAAAAARAAHAVDTAYPYMANWRQRRDAAVPLDGGESSHPPGTL